MVIGHYKATPIAYAPEAIADVINKYTEHHAYVFGYGYPKGRILPHTDIVHEHNTNPIAFHKKVIQYHSEPFRVDLQNNLTKLVIAQYHATLPEYKGCTIVRNPIDLFHPHFLPKYYEKKIRIGFAPSVTNPTTQWNDKGYAETLPVLHKIKEKYGKDVDIDVIVDMPLDECLFHKVFCNIMIDEVKTGSYHRSGLEGLAMGQLTICSISPEVEHVMLKASGADRLPFVNVYHNQLYEKLCWIIDQGLNYVLSEGWKARQWMEEFWHPRIIANEYIRIYETIK